MNQTDSPIKVSVLIMTYNHARFISKAIDSALMQQTVFHYEIIISEDCSTDGTREIVLDYKQRFPEKILFDQAKSSSIAPGYYLH